jgi:hypothetical protein
MERVRKERNQGVGVLEKVRNERPLSQGLDNLTMGRM